MVETDTSRVVDLYMGASESTLDRRRSVVDRLESLQSSGDIDRFRVRSWPQRVVVDGPNEDLVTVVERFQQWADDAGVSLGSAFERWTYNRSFTESRASWSRCPRSRSPSTRTTNSSRSHLTRRRGNCEPSTKPSRNWRNARNPLNVDEPRWTNPCDVTERVIVR